MHFITAVFLQKGKFSGLSIPLLYVLIPLTNFGYLWMADSTTLTEAQISNNLIYIGGCIVNPVVMFIIMDMCKLKYKKWFPTTVFIYNIFILLSEFSNKHHHLFYRSVTFERPNGIGYII